MGTPVVQRRWVGSLAARGLAGKGNAACRALLVSKDFVKIYDSEEGPDNLLEAYPEES